MIRVPIKVGRVPIKLPLDIKMTLKLEELRDETQDDDILSMAKHYEMLAIDFKKSTGYTALSRNDPKSHRNWKHFERIYYICRMKNWDTKLYLESQFNRAKNWVYNVTVPQPAQMYSVRAIKDFSVYAGNRAQIYKHDTNQVAKKKGKQTKTLNEQVLDELIRSIEIVKFYIDLSEFQDKERYKAFRIYQSWQELSPFYLWSVPWFHNIVHSLDQSQLAIECKDEFVRISEASSLQKIIKESVPKLEQMFNLPENIDL